MGIHWIKRLEPYGALAVRGARKSGAGGWPMQWRSATEAADQAELP